VKNRNDVFIFGLFVFLCGVGLGRTVHPTPKPITLSFTFNDITPKKADELTSVVTQRLMERGVLPGFQEVKK
jgi:hypothetical protein